MTSPILRGDGKVGFRAVRKGVFYAVSASILYMLVVVITTPNLAPLDSILTAISLNWWIIAGVSLGAGIQVFLITYARERACDLRMNTPVTGATGIFSAFAAFLSYLALIPVGCCGMWLYLVSFLPGIIGVGASAILVDYSRSVATIGLALMALAVLYTYLSLRRRLTSTKLSR